MTARKIDARHGVLWLVHAARLMASQPAPFLLMGAMLSVIGAVPLLGPLVVFLLGPAFNGGIMLAAREQLAGKGARFDMLWAALRQPGKLPPMLALCLPALLAILTGIAFLVVFHGDAITAIAASMEADGKPDAEQLASLASVLPVFLLLALVAYAMVFFAVPRVMLDGVQPLPAMLESLQLCLRNLGAMFMLMLATMVMVLVLVATTGWLPILLQLLLGLVVTPLIAITNLIAFLDVFAVPPAPGDGPPPASPTLQA